MKVVNKLKQLLSAIRGLFPSSLPQGLTEFIVWKQSIIDAYNPPGDERSIKFVLSSLLMRLGPSEAYKSKFYFACSLKRAAASQVAVYIQEEIKQQQREEQEAALKEATTKVEASNDQSPQN